MSAGNPASSNPFRRKDPGPPPSSIITTTSLTPSIPSTNDHIPYQNSNILDDTTGGRKEPAKKKVPKRVKIQSPPTRSPSLPDSASTIGEGEIHFRPPTPLSHRYIEADPFENTTSDVSDDETVSQPPPEDSSRISPRAPINPFQRTLETLENTKRDGSQVAAAIQPTGVSSPGRASMDVDAFKRLLMTGNSGLSAAPGAPPAYPVHHGLLGDGGSSTDTSSLSRQSIFEPVQEAHPESPRTSHEISEPEDDRRGLVAELALPLGRKKPPPPSSRHGKLIKVELRDDPAANSRNSPPTPSSGGPQTYLPSISTSNRSLTDLNKPLPPSPSRASHESERDSVFDRESAGKKPEPPSPTTSVRKKTPPAPPLARRHSQLVSDSKLIRSESGRLSPKAEEENLPISVVDQGRPRSNSSRTVSSIELGRPRSDSARAPPPPPSRRLGSVRSSSHHLPLASPSSSSLPPPPPARPRSFASGKPSSVHSMDMSISKRAANAPPPPPPPHRHERTSMDGNVASPVSSTRASGEHSRRSLDSGRRGSTISPISQAGGVDINIGGHDILADLSALQREIDALRSQSEKNIT